MKKLKKFAAGALAVVLCATSIMTSALKTAEAACNHVIYYAGVTTLKQQQWCQSYHYKWNYILGRWEYVGSMPLCHIEWKIQTYRCNRCSYSYDTWTKARESHGHYIY